MIFGKTGNEESLVVSFDGFCSMCKRRYYKNEEVLSLDASHKWLAHYPNCSPFESREHKATFLSVTKIRGSKSKKKAKNRK